MVVTHNQFGFDIIHVRALILHNPVSSRAEITLAFDRDDGMGFDLGSHWNLREGEQQRIFSRHPIEAGDFKAMLLLWQIQLFRETLQFLRLAGQSRRNSDEPASEVSDE